MVKVTWPQVTAWRARQQHLDKRASKGNMLAVTRRLCGVQAQVMSCAELALWARVEGIRRDEIQRALWQDRSLVKAWAMRGTLHLLVSSEWPLWRAVLGTIDRYRSAALWRRFGLTLKQVEQLTQAVGRALDGRLLTREQLAQEVGRLSGSKVSRTIVQSWGTVLRPAAFRGYLCFGPSIGQRVQFTHPDSWVKGISEDLAPQDAVREIARRFLRVYGPATHHDLARWWNGGGIGVARQWIASLGEEAVQVDLQGTKAWMLKVNVNELADTVPSNSVRLLPGFDQFVLAASCHSEKLSSCANRSRIYRPQGWISPVLLVNGRMEGVWRHEVKVGRVEVTVEPFGKVPGWARRGAGEEAERLAVFLGGNLKLNWKN